MASSLPLTMHFSQKALPLTLVLAAISACSAGDGGEDGSAEEASSGGAEESGDQTIAMAGTGWLTVGTDGAVQTTFIDADGRYRDLRNGTLLAEGNWQQRPDGAVCFEPDAGIGECWTTSATSDDGTIVATDGDGKRIEITQVTYIPPSAEESGEESIGETDG